MKMARLKLGGIRRRIERNNLFTVKHYLLQCRLAILIFVYMEAVVNKQSLITKLKTNSGKLKSFGVAKLGIFGSFAKGSPTPESDIDFLIEFVPGKKSYDNFIDLSFYLEELLGRRVEIVTPQSLSKYIGPHILKNAEYVAL